MTKEGDEGVIRVEQARSKALPVNRGLIEGPGIVQPFAASFHLDGLDLCCIAP